MKPIQIPSPEDSLRNEIKRIIVGSKSERDLINRIEALVIQEVQSAIADQTIELVMPKVQND